MEAILDASLYGANDVYSDGFLRSSSILDTDDAVGLFRHSVVGHRASDAPTRGPWAPPDGLRERTFVPIGATNGWHIDDGSLRPYAKRGDAQTHMLEPHDSRAARLTRRPLTRSRPCVPACRRDSPDFKLASYLRNPWLIAVVLLTDVSDDGGPTTLCPGTHHTMARLLSVCPPGGLSTSSVYSFCSSVYTWWCGFGGHAAAAAAAAAGGGGDGGGGGGNGGGRGGGSGGHSGQAAEGKLVRATGRAGDVYLLHPLLLHSATISCTGEGRAILNMPLPYSEAHVAKLQGSLSGVTLPILQAQALRHWTPLPLLWLLWRLAIGFGWLHRATRGTRGAGALDYVRAWLLFPLCALSLLLGTLCFWLLDMATRHSSHADHRPLIDDGVKGAGCRGVLEWLSWAVRAASRKAAGWSRARRRGGARGGAVRPAGRCESPAELRPLVEQ